MNPVKRKIYPYEYAAGVVNEFLDSYGRVHIFLSRKLQIEPKALRLKLIKAFMYNNARWHIIKTTMKNVHNWNMYDQIAGMTAEGTRKYLRALSTLVEDDFIERGFPEK